LGVRRPDGAFSAQASNRPWPSFAALSAEHSTPTRRGQFPIIRLIRTWPFAARPSKNVCRELIPLCYVTHLGSVDVKLHEFSRNLQRKEVAMSATLLYRIAAFVFALFALGHTYGFLSLHAPSAEGRAVYDAMNAVHFELGGRSFSYGGFYRGFGLSCTVSMVLSAFLSWHLGNLARSAPGAIGALGWVFFVVQLAGVVLSFLYFGLPPMVLSALVAIIVGLAAWLVGR
jgi:hypothetical protein